jgi:hypothetical protein
MLADLREQAVSLGLNPHPEPTNPAERKKWLDSTRQAWARGMKEVQEARVLRLEAGFVWDPGTSVIRRDTERGSA